MPKSVFWLRLAPVLAFLFCALGATAHSETYALLIGINDYPNVRPLKGAIHDVQDIRKVLIVDLKVPEANIQMLVNQEATRKAVIEAFTGLTARTKPGDAVLIYYSGHGWLIKSENPDELSFDEDTGWHEAIVPYDAVAHPRERAFEANPTLIRDDEISAALGPLRGRRVAVVFDSCHAGNGLRSLPGLDASRSLYDLAIPASRFKSLTPRRPTLNFSSQVVFIAAAQFRQTASDLGEFEGRRHGALTASLLRTIQSAGSGWANVLSWEALYRRVREDLLSQGIASQTPAITGSPMLARRPIAQFFEPPAPEEIADLAATPAFNVYLEANRYQFVSGEQMQLGIESELDGYLYIFDIDPERKVTQLFPNEFESDNRLPAGRQARVPGPKARYQFTAGMPYGFSSIVVVVTRAPWDEHARLHLPASLAPLSPAQENGLRSSLRDLLGGGGQKEVLWASQKITVEVAAKRAGGESTPVSAAPPAAPAVSSPAATAAATVAAGAAGTGKRAESLDDSDLTWEEQQDMQRLRPALHRKLEQMAERFSPVFWQDVSGETEGRFRPWKDFFIRYDFDQTAAGPNWPAPPGFQDEVKRQRIRSLDVMLDQGKSKLVAEVKETPGVFRVTDANAGENTVLDIRPHVYWTVLATSTHYFFHYAAFKAEDWKPLFGHPGDMEGCTIIVDRKTEKIAAALTLAHDDVQVTRSLDGENESNIEVLVDPSMATRDLSAEDSRPINGALRMDATRAGNPAPREHQDIYSETRGHGQYGPGKIHPSRYIIYANYLPDDAWRAPSFNKADYVVSDKIGEISTKYKYRLIYFGSGQQQGRDLSDKTMWGEYKELPRFPGGINPPWCWRDNLFSRTGWWKDPRMILKIGDGQYRINPYLKPGDIR